MHATRTLSAMLLLVALCASQASLTQDPGGLDLEALGTEIERGVAAVTGRAFRKPVAIATTNAEEFTAYAIGKLEEDGGAERMASDEVIAKHLGLVGRDVDLRALTLEVLAEQVGGFYDPPTDSFRVVEGLSADLTRVIMAHEFTHALDDQHYDLDGLDTAREGSTDAQLALHALAEGSAMEVMERWMMANLATLDMAAVQESQASFSSAALQAAPSYVWKPLLASYMAGQTFLRKVERRTLLTPPASMADVERAWSAPPRSMEQVLHPAKYWDPEQVDEPTAVTLPDALIPEGWTARRRDTLGELLLGILVTPPKQRSGLEVDPMKLMSMSYTHPAAAGWDGDQVVLLRGPEGAAATVLLTVWDSATDADEFEASLVPALGPEFAGAVESAEDRADAPAPLVRAGRAVALVRGDVARLGLDRTALRAHLVALDRSLGEE